MRWVGQFLPCREHSHIDRNIRNNDDFAGVLGRDDVSQLGDVLAGTAEGRKSARDITIFDSTGLAIQDLAIALAAMERAEELDLPNFDL